LENIFGMMGSTPLTARMESQLRGCQWPVCLNEDGKEEEDVPMLDTAVGFSNKRLDTLVRALL
jgi:hypothetical protein